MSVARFTARVSTREPSKGRPRAISLRARVAAIVLDARHERPMSQLQVATLAGVSRQLVGQIEAGSANPSLTVTERVLDALAIDWDLVVRPRIAIGSTPQTRDAAHAILSSYTQRRLERMGLKVAREVRIETDRYLGWIDLLAYEEATGTLYLIELKTRIDDLGAIERSMDWYAREAFAAARRLGWAPKRSVRLLLALATDEVEARLIADRGAISAAFPMRADAILGLLLDPGSVRTGMRGVALVDPGSKRRGWLIRTRLDGRRSAMPYRDYAGFMRSRSPATRR